ncbi:MAG: methyltransferase [bacterium]|jgi:hypothetical protein|nr:acetylserotonin O-methyltransferase [Betaproteobacteria bacterium]
MKRPVGATGVDAQRPSEGAAQELLDLINASWSTQAIGAAVRLGVPDHVAAGCDTATRLAAATGCDRAALKRLLNGLLALGILQHHDADRYRLTARGNLLCRDAPDGLHAHALWWSGHAWSAWTRLADSVRTGRGGRAQGARGAFRHLDARPVLAEEFHSSMQQLTRAVARDVARSPLLPDEGTVLDLGGGYGELLVAVLQSRPGLQGVLLELDHAIDVAHERIARARLQQRIRILAGSFFDPPACRAARVLLKSVLHDWSDHDAVAILRRARESLAPGGAVLVVERLLPERVEDCPAHRNLMRSDLNMLVGPGGKERTAAAFGSLLAQAGLVRTELVGVAAGFSILSARPAC